MKSQNSKEQKSDFSYKETLNLLKTDFSMRANSVAARIVKTIYNANGWDSRNGKKFWNSGEFNIVENAEDGKKSTCGVLDFKMRDLECSLFGFWLLTSIQRPELTDVNYVLHGIGKIRFWVQPMMNFIY